MNGKVISLHTHKAATCKTQHVLAKSGVHKTGQIKQITGRILSQGTPWAVQPTEMQETARAYELGEYHSRYRVCVCKELLYC